MKTLNFFPYYEAYLSSGKKTTTFRVGDRPLLNVGEQVMLTIGWDEQRASNLHQVTIKDVYQKRISELSAHDFDGESPDCQNTEATKLVLGCVYRKVLTDDDIVCVIKFDHLKS